MADDPNATIGAAIRARRERAGISQVELARRMSDQGHAWHPVTVGRTETGKRPVRLDEAAALAGILAVPIAALFEPPPRDDPIAQATLEALTEELHKRYVELGMAMQERAAAEIRSEALKEASVVEQNRLAAAEEAVRMVQHAMDEVTRTRAEMAGRVRELRIEVERLRAEVERHRARFEATIPVAPLPPPSDALGHIERRRRGLPAGGE